MSNWTSVKDKLPEVKDWNYNTEETENFIVVVYWFGYDDMLDEPIDDCFVATAEYSYVQRTWKILFADSSVVTNGLLTASDINHHGYWVSHWMPMPKPPKEEVND